MNTVEDRHSEFERVLELQLLVDEVQSVTTRLLERVRRLSTELDRVVDELDQEQPTS